MNGTARRLIVTGAVLAFLGVALGAFGAHALKTRIEPELLSAYQTGVQYHLVHALGVILVGVLVQVLPPATRGSKALVASGWTMMIGLILFSGSLYLLALSGVRSLGIVTPFGGMALLTAWLMLVVGMIKSR
ncbi:MAG: DUF423 domain-containing protein [Betaproteobacteria bacterium]